MRDDFTSKVKQALAKRVAQHCSNPKCRAPTSGPQLNEGGAVNVGRAAHITGASPGGARYDATLTPRQRGAQNNGIWLCAICADKVDKDSRAYPVGLLRQWKQIAEREARRDLGVAKAKVVSPIARERQIKRDLNLRDRMRRDFLKPFDPSREEDRLAHQHQRFRHAKIIIHSIDDTTYPRAEDDPNRLGISGWFRVEPFDFYHGGLEVILDLRRGIKNPKQRWALLGHRDVFDARLFREMQVWVLGRIPWRNIRHYDLRGDNYYNEPHLYCAFADNGTPYEEIAHAQLDATYNWPLDPALRFEFKPTKP